jgi:uncharacterized membrane protein YccC
VATFGRLVHIPELLLIALALLPLALIVAHNSAFRTSMVAAVIVLSAPATSGAPLYVAGARMLGVSLGAIIGALVSLTILPSRREVVVARATANLLDDFPNLLRNAFNPGTDDRARDRFEFRVRQALRELGMLIRDRADAPPVKGPATAVVKFTVQMHADMVFLKRELQSIAPAEDQSFPAAALEALEGFGKAFAGTTANVALLARGRSGHPDIQALREACGQAAKSLRDECPNSEGARLMLRRLVEDLISLLRWLERTSVVTPARERV